MSTLIDVKTIPRPHGFTLNELKFSVRFHGDIFIQELPEHIPLQISVRVDDKWAALLPVVCVTSKGDLTQNEPLTPAMFPFLPLPRNFQPFDTCEWQRLAKEIETCLLADPHLSNIYPECYRLMRELFWMAFVAAFPTFPHGQWPVWDSRISMEGEFISRWLLNDSVDADSDDVSGLPNMQARQLVWKDFTSTVEKSLSISVTH